jgi:hypothetical protein
MGRSGDATFSWTRQTLRCRSSNEARSATSSFRPILVLLALLGMAQPLTYGESGKPGSGSRPEWAEDGRNHLAVFVGFTDGRGDAGPSLGLDYEYRLSRLFGIGGTIEYTAAGTYG